MKTDNAQKKAFDWVVTQIELAGNEVHAQMLRIDPTLDEKVSGQTAWGSVAALYFNTASKLIEGELLDEEYVIKNVSPFVPERKSDPREFDLSDFREHSSWYDEFTFNGKTGEIYDEVDIGELPMKFSVQLFRAVYDYEQIDDELGHCFVTRYCRDEIEKQILQFLNNLQKKFETPESKAKIDRYITVLGSEN